MLRSIVFLVRVCIRCRNRFGSMNTDGIYYRLGIALTKSVWLLNIAIISFYVDVCKTIKMFLEEITFMYVVLIF